MKVWMLLLLAIPFSALSSEFSRIKLTPEFEQHLTRAGAKSNAPSPTRSKSPNALSAAVPAPAPTAAGGSLQARLLSALLGATGPVPVDGEESPLYEEIRRHLEASHRTIGLSEVQNLNRLNQQFNLGTANFSGFSWQRPFGVVQVYADRQVTPNIFGENWLVMDTFTFEVEAATFLERLAGANLATMSASEIGAFAGIKFRRSYTYWHYAASFQEGLTADFSRLFLPFMSFNQAFMERMGNEEILKREDVWTASAGGLISTPPLYNVSFSAGVLAEFDYQNVTSIQSNLAGDHRFQVGVLAKKTASSGATLELQLDFFKLLKLTLLRYDINYEYAAGTEYTLGLRPEQWEAVKASADLGGELRALLRGTGTVKRLEPFVVRLDEASSSALQQRGSVLLWGRLQKQKTEQIRVITAGLVKVFHKNYAQSVRVVQNLFSRLFSAVIYKLLKLPVGVNNAAVYSKQLTIEYEATHPQAADPALLRVESAEQFSFVLTQYYNAARTDRWIDRRFKNDVIWFVDNFTTLPKTYKTDLRNEVLKGPLQVESNLRVEKAGFQHLLEAPLDDVFGHLARVCESTKASAWTAEDSRRALLAEAQAGPEKCVRDLGLYFLDFKADYANNFLKPSLAKFKQFLTKYYKKAQNIADLQALFGPENTFVNGRLQARTSVGVAFSTTFSAGQFRGLGVIDNFKRTTGGRTPASIVSE